MFQLMGLSTVTTFVFTTTSISSPGSMMCEVMKLEERSKACSGVAELGPIRPYLIGVLGLTMICAAVSSFHLGEVIPGSQIAHIAENRDSRHNKNKKEKS